MRHVLIHYHVFKNAGTTLSEMLRNTLGANAWEQYEPADHLPPMADADPTIRHLSERPRLLAISSHRLQYPPLRDPGIVFHDLVFVRDPIDRLLSTYRHLQRSPEDASDLSVLPLSVGLRAFVESLADKLPWHINSQQVRFLSHRGEAGHLVNQADYEVACQTIADAAAPGVVDLFYESARTAEWLLRPHFNHLRLATAERHNASLDQSVSSEDNRRTLREQCGLRLYQTVLRLTQYDLALVEFARREVMRRFLALPVGPLEV